MHTRAQLHRRRALLTQAWDKHVPAICDRRRTNAARADVPTEIVASWERSAAHIMPEVSEAPLADTDETRLAWETSPLSGAVRHLEGQLQAAADDGELVVAVCDPSARTVALRNALLSDPHPAAVQRYLELTPHDLDLLDSGRDREPTDRQP